MSQSYLKASIDGLNGSGKTGTAARLAVGLAIEYCDRSPVIVSDSEERWRFLKHIIFDVEKVPLIIVPGQSLIGVQESFEVANAKKAGVWIADQLTTPWMEGVRKFSFENGELSFSRRQQLINQWDPVVSQFRYSPFHCVGIGRLGYNWSNVEDENGEMKLIQGDSKFNAGGSNNFGYEADLELEMRRKKGLVGAGKKLMGRFFKSKMSVEHICEVVKDAAAGIINGEQFIFDSAQGLYKAGDYKQVLDAFRPYIEFMKQIEAPEKPTSGSGELIVSGKTAWARDKSERTALLEELDSNLDFCFGSKQSTQGKMFRNLTLEELNGFVSWSRMEEETLTPDIERSVLVVRKMRARIEKGEVPTEQISLKKLVDLAIQDVYHPGKHMTLIEAMGEMSIADAQRKKANGRDTAA